MRKINIFLASFLMLAVGTSAAAAGRSWQQPISATFSGGTFTDVEQLKTTGDAVYYRYDVSAPTSLRIQVALPRAAASRFVPQVVVFAPNETTIGPNLPLTQPPQTMAIVYPQTAPRTIFDPGTQTMYTVRLETTVSLSIPGKYLVAVYNAGSAAGAYRLVMSRGVVSTAMWSDAVMMPMEWWRDQAFAGFSWLTLIAPSVFILMIWLVYLRLDHHQLHVHKVYPKKNKAQSSPRKT